ncbi:MULTISPECIES: HNH endonuclease signature motif containing protein [Mammaliicoccus]|uniref:HNH endonuclease signature motif containing protein n=1 Tax=Mammaliicoccus TaxID=2803850 RepID=UPI001071E0EA|nr:HNH endonuclease signature motif containing protein [Mammaliicoccus lentus]MBF0750439.1 HNH endonuclease [Mammaliicoccus lentus]TFU56487.1 HNH endonuclease [Mammaliicoccus lentus]
MSRIYTEEQTQFIKDNVKGTPFKKLAEMFNQRFGTNKSVGTISSFCARNKLNNGLNTQFKKGHQSWNKGVKGLYAPGVEKGWFKKGDTPINKRPIGSTLDGKDGYVLVKIKDNGTRTEMWRPKHELIWEEINGPKPDNHVIIFADGNKRNFDIDNLILIKRSELLKLNRQKLIFSNPELTKAGLGFVKLQEKLIEVE